MLWPAGSPGRTVTLSWWISRQGYSPALALDKAKQALASRFPGQDCNPVLVDIKEPLPGTTLVRDMVNGTMVQGYSGDGGDLLATLCDMVTHGDKVLTIAVLVILITAPIGAVAIMTGGPKLLENEREGKGKTEEEKA